MTSPRKIGMPPIWNSDARLLILGTLPGDESLRLQQYYGHPRNHFWPLLCDIIGVAMPANYEDRCALLKQHRIAVWDVLFSAERTGSLDTGIRNARANDFEELFRDTPNLKTVIFNGQKAHALFRTNVAADLFGGVSFHILPSTSPAHVRPLPEKLVAWRAALQPNLTRIHSPSRRSKP